MSELPGHEDVARRKVLVEEDEGEPLQDVGAFLLELLRLHFVVFHPLVFSHAAAHFVDGLLVRCGFSPLLPLLFIEAIFRRIRIGASSSRSTTFQSSNLG